MITARLSLLALLLIPLACTADPPAPKAAKDGAAKQPAAEQPAAETPEDEPATPTAKAYELSSEELELIAADPSTLTPDQNRKRGYALRKKVMQNPDSAAAKSLEEARQAALAGQLELPTKGDNEVVIPAPEHLKNQDQSYAPPEPDDAKAAE